MCKLRAADNSHSNHLVFQGYILYKCATMSTIQFRTSARCGESIVYARHRIRTVHCEDRIPTTVDCAKLPQYLEVRAEADIIVSTVVLVDDNRNGHLSSKLASCLAEYLKLVRVLSYCVICSNRTSTECHQFIHIASVGRIFGRRGYIYEG